MRVRISSLFASLFGLALITSFAIFITLLVVSLRSNTHKELNKKFTAVLNLNERILNNFYERNLLLSSALADDYMIIKAFVDLKDGLEASKIDTIRDIYQSARQDRKSILMRDGTELYEFMHEAHHPQFRKYLGTSFFTDLLLISNSGQVFYSYQKSKEFTRNIYKLQTPKTKAIVKVSDIIHADRNVAITVYRQDEFNWNLVTATSIKIKGKKAGYAVTITPFSYLGKQLNTAGVLGASGKIILVQGNSTPVAWSETVSSAANNRQNPQWDAIMKLGQTDNSQPVKLAGKIYYTQQKKFFFGNKPYKLIIKQDEKEIFLTSNHLQYQLISVGIIILFVALTAGVLFMRLLSQPLAIVTEKLIKVTANDFSDMSRTNSSIYEVAKITNAFEAFREGAMAKRKLEEDLVCRSHETEMLNEDLKLANQELEEYRDHLEDRIKSRTEIIEQQAAQLEVALQAQKDLNDLQRSFVSMASHEFRTPLALIDIVAQKVLRRAKNIKPEKLSEFGMKIRAAVKRMTGLMESTLALAKMENGKLKLHTQPCDLRKIIHDCRDNQKELTPSHDIIVHIGDIPEEVLLDPSAIEQVITNLLSNAVKYSPGESEVNITAETEDQHITILVSDNGLGIDEEDLPKMFSRFFRAETSTGIAGTGIGLNLCKMLVEEHGGDINLTSEKGVGSTFKISIPIKPEERPLQTK